jgi:WD40 repeat protein
VLQKLVIDLKNEIQKLRVQNASLEAEVEMYRSDAGTTMASGIPAVDQQRGGGANEEVLEVLDDPFFRSGDGRFCQNPGIVIQDSHGSTNPLCLALSPDETMICSGGANGVLLLFQWGAVANDGVIPEANRVEVSLPAPVVGVAATHKMVAAGCMDGSVHIVQYETVGGRLRIVARATAPLKHAKFCKNVLWCQDDILVSAAADGDVHLYRVTASGPLDDVDEPVIGLKHWKSLHLGVAVECACRYRSKLILYTRGTTYLTVIDLEDDLGRSILNLNERVAGGFSDHVSFAVLDMAIHKNYLACATDANRHIVIDIEKEVIVRNLYGHDADGYSTPRLSWSSNGQYIYCNTQHASAMVVYEVASGKIVREIKEPHNRPIKDMCSAASTDLLVTTSFDRQTCIWFPEESS